MEPQVNGLQVLTAGLEGSPVSPTTSLSSPPTTPVLSPDHPLAEAQVRDMMLPYHHDTALSMRPQITISRSSSFDESEYDSATVPCGLDATAYLTDVAGPMPGPWVPEPTNYFHFTSPGYMVHRELPPQLDAFVPDLGGMPYPDLGHTVLT